MAKPQIEKQIQDPLHLLAAQKPKRYPKIWLNSGDSWAALGQRVYTPGLLMDIHSLQSRGAGMAASQRPNAIMILNSLALQSAHQSGRRQALHCIFPSTTTSLSLESSNPPMDRNKFFKFFHQGRILVNSVASTPAQRLQQSECHCHVCWISEQIVLKINRPTYPFLGQTQYNYGMYYDHLMNVLW